MATACDFCGKIRSTVYCRSDAASLCLSCNRKVHDANLFRNRTCHISGRFSQRVSKGLWFQQSIRAKHRNPNTAKSSSNSTVEGSEGKNGGTARQYVRSKMPRLWFAICNVITPFPILQIITEKKEPEFIGYESNLPQILCLHQRFRGL